MICSQTPPLTEYLHHGWRKFWIWMIFNAPEPRISTRIFDNAHMKPRKNYHENMKIFMRISGLSWISENWEPCLQTPQPSFFNFCLSVFRFIVVGTTPEMFWKVILHRLLSLNKSRMRGRKFTLLSNVIENDKTSAGLEYCFQISGRDRRPNVISIFI